MLPIADLPFLGHQLAHLRRHGIRHVTFACGFLPRAIIEYFGDGENVGLELSYVVEPEPLGTGGAIGFAARGVDAPRLLVCNGDVLTGLDITSLVRQHLDREAVATIALTPVDDPSRYGVVQTGEGGQVHAFIEKPPPGSVDTNLINAGTYVVEPAMLALIPDEGACSVEREIFPALVDKGLFAFADHEYWNDIGTFPSYLAANIDMLSGRVAGGGEFSTAAGGRSFVHPDARISPDATVHAPVCIGPQASVAAGATVGPHAVLATGAILEGGARAVRSVLLERSIVEREGQVVDTLLGEDAAVSARSSVSDGAVVGPGERVDQPVLRGGTVGEGSAR